MLGISTDITEHKLLEKALSEAKQEADIANQAKSEFIANMSHDLRTPITGMIGLMEKIDDKAKKTQTLLAQPSDEVIKLLKEIENADQLLIGATDQLLFLFNDILDTICLESGQSKATIESFNLHELMARNEQLLLPVAQHKKLDLSYSIQENVPTYLTGICHDLGRILLNLISNALKFTPQGFVKVTVSCTDHSSNMNNVGEQLILQFSIEDSGIGIPNDKFKIIFENFSRLTSAYDGVYKGTGLGLYKVKQYVENMGERLTSIVP